MDVDEEGVRTGDWLDESREEGDAVPSLGSLFFLEDLLGSLPRDSCDRRVSNDSNSARGQVGGAKVGHGSPLFD